MSGKRFVKPQDLHDLQKIWYDKLRKSGFKDIEREDGSLMYPGHRASEKDKTYTAPSVEEYYRLARMFLHDFRFATKTERQIWSLHSEGAGARIIAKTLGLKKTQVGTTLQRLAAIMMHVDRIDLSENTLENLDLGLFKKLASTYELWREAQRIPAQPTPKRGSGENL